MDAIILAGGKGTRMEYELPKPLVPAKGVPILDRQIKYLAPRVSRIILSIGHRADEIIRHVKQQGFANVDFCVETEPLGTAGGLKKALIMSNAEKVVVLNCDDVADVDTGKLAGSEEHVICVAHPTLPFGLVEENNGYAVFKEKPVMREWSSMGWYCFVRNDILKHLPDKGMLEYDVFPKIKLRVHKHEGFWCPMNQKKEVQEFEKRELPDALRF